MSRPTPEETIRALFAHSTHPVSAAPSPQIPSSQIRYSNNGNYAYLEDGTPVRLSEPSSVVNTPAAAAASIEEASHAAFAAKIAAKAAAAKAAGVSPVAEERYINGTADDIKEQVSEILQPFMFDMLRVLTYHFVTHAEDILHTASKKHAYTYPPNSFLFLLKGGNAVSLWRNHAERANRFPVNEMGDMDCVILVNPALPKEAFTNLHTFLLDLGHRILTYNSKIRNTASMFKLDASAHSAEIKNKLNKIGVHLLNPEELITNMPSGYSGYGGTLQLKIRQAFAKWGVEFPPISVLDIVIPLQTSPLLEFEFNLYSIGRTDFIIQSPSKLLNIPEDFDRTIIIATPVALLYELSVIKSASHERNNAKQRRRNERIKYLKTRNNVRTSANKTRRNILRNNTSASRIMRLMARAGLYNSF
jgi:hypothetical protein